MPQLRLGMRIIDPASILHAFENYFASRKRKMLGRMQVRPLDVMECVTRFQHRKFQWTDIDIKRTVEVSIQIQSTCFEERTLAFEGAVGIIFRRARCDAVALYNNTVNRNPISHRVPYKISHSVISVGHFD